MHVPLVLFICLGFIVPLDYFHSYEGVIITDEGLQISTCARHSLPLSSEGSIASHTYCTYNSGFRGAVTFTPIAETFAVVLSLPVFTG